MTISVLRWADHVPVPWKNGGGVTREVAGGFSDFGWRVSVADVSTSGPFSVFPGVDRTIMGVEGSGMVLSLDGVEREVALLALSNGVTIAGHQLGHLDAALVTGHLAVRGPVAIVRITTQAGNTPTQTGNTATRVGNTGVARSRSRVARLCR